MAIYSNSIRELYALHESLAMFIQNNSSKVVGKAGMVINYNYRVLHDSLKEYIEERTRIITENGTPDENGNHTIDRETEKGAAAFEEIEKLEDAYLSLPLMTIPMADFDQLAEKVTLVNLSALVPMTTEYLENIINANAGDKAAADKDEAEDEGDEENKPDAEGRYSNRKNKK